MDTESYSLRSFVEKLDDLGELETINDPTALGELGHGLHGAKKAVLFTNVGPEQTEVVGNVMGGRRQLAAALDVPEGDMRQELLKRLKSPQDVIEIPSEDAPVHQVVWQGDEADFTKLPVPFQHGLDGGPYISATIDFVIEPESGWTNVGVRRLMLRGRREAGVDINAPSDLRAIYEKTFRQGKKLPIAFALGAHPTYYIAATQRMPVNEIDILANLRGASLPVVKCLHSDIRVPADAEIILEGYLDERGLVEKEGPFGEFLGYYGVVKNNPVFHLTAVTMRENALFQTATIGGRYLGRTETAQLNALRSEVVVWQAVSTAVREPTAVFTSPASGGMFNVRLAMRQRVPGEARNAMAAIFGCFANVKNVFVVDDDINVFSDEQMDWAMSTRFQPGRDIFVESGFRSLPLDPSLDGMRTATKAGYDLTIPFGKRDSLEFSLPEPPEFGEKRFDDVRQSLANGPKHFGEIMGDVGSRDGRDVVIQLDELRSEGKLTRLEDGKYAVE